MDVDGVWQACRTKPEGVGRMSGYVGKLPVCEVKKTDDNRAHRFTGTHICEGSSLNWSVFLGKSYHGVPREGSGSMFMQYSLLHS